MQIRFTFLMQADNNLVMAHGFFSMMFELFSEILFDLTTIQIQIKLDPKLNPFSGNRDHLYNILFELTRY